MTPPSDTNPPSPDDGDPAADAAGGSSASVRDAPGRREFSREVTDFETADQVAKYQAWRYGTSGQALVDRVERARLAGVLENLVGRGPLSALDIPCGYGRISPLLLELGYELTWGDLAPAMVRATAAQFAGRPSIGAFAADISALPLADDSVDLTVTIRLWHHLDSPELRQRILSELGRISRRWCLVSFYDRASLHKLSKGLAKRLQGRTSKISMISRRKFRQEAEGAGLRVRKIRSVARGIHAHTYALLESLQ